MTLRADLLRRCELDQEIRERAPRCGPLPPELAEERERIDRDNTAFLKQVLAEHGWPGRDLVGDDGADCAWLFAQHAGLDLDFQRECLPLLEEAARSGQASLKNWAYLLDRVRVAAGRPAALLCPRDVLSHRYGPPRPKIPDVSYPRDMEISAMGTRTAGDTIRVLELIRNNTGGGRRRPQHPVVDRPHRHGSFTGGAAIEIFSQVLTTPGGRNAPVVRSHVPSTTP